MVILVVQQIVNGLVLGGVYALIAVGLTLVFGVLNQANFAHCDQYTMAGYAVFICLLAGIPFPIAAIAGVATATFMGLGFYRLLWRPTMERPPDIGVLVFFGACLMIEGSILALYSPQTKAVYVPFFGNALHLGGLLITQGRLLTIVVSVMLLVMVHFLITRTRTGMAMRAVAQDLRAAKLMGINLYPIGLITFVLGGVLAGVAGILLIPIYGAVSPMGGFWMVIRAFSIIIIGGMGNVPGTIAAAFLIGLLESMFSGFVSATLKDLIPWATVIIVLWIRPQGLLGRGIRRAG